MALRFRFWIIFSFGIILTICLIACWLFIRSINRSDKFEEYHSRLKSTRILLLEINKLKEDILIADFNETGFYSSNTSATEKKFWHLNQKINNFITFLEHSSITKEYGLKPGIDTLEVKLGEFNANYRQLIYLYKLKGFKNYGLEGKMREYAHNIYDVNNKDVQLYCLMLRRHEKDFLLRKDMQYVQAFDRVSEKLISFLKSSHALSVSQTNYLANQLYFYNKYFKLLVRIESRIGVKGKSGYLEKSKQIFNSIAGKIELLDGDLLTIITQDKKALKRNTIILVLILFVFLLSVIYVFTHIINRSVKSISFMFSNYVNSGFNYDSILHKKSNIKEFNEISISFIKMAKEINLFTNFFKEKVHERTLAINQQKEEIKTQQEEIENQYQVLLSKNTQLTEQKQLLALKNSDIQDSLRYAKRIQRALQPRLNEFKRYFNDSFVYYKPRDVVSGDFYLVYNQPNILPGDNNKLLFIASDCTGHGVPGAIMSVLGINTIQKIIQEQNNTDPGFILNQLDKDINHILVKGKQTEEIVADGMEIAVFSFDKSTYLLEYCIAKFSHFLVRDSVVMNLNTHKSSIGYSFFEKEVKDFETHRFQLKPGDCLYLFSDGFADQFGGPLNKKYKKSSIKSLIEKIHQLDMKSQKAIFKQEFMDWKKPQKQIDDVMVLGIRF